MAQNQTGQPADIIAVKNNIAVLIDCKVCGKFQFPLTRVEPNQESAMEWWAECNNAYAFFALKLPDDSIYMLPDIMIFEYAKCGVSRIDTEIKEYGMDIQTWLSCYGEENDN